MKNFEGVSRKVKKDVKKEKAKKIKKLKRKE